MLAGGRGERIYLLKFRVEGGSSVGAARRRRRRGRPRQNVEIVPHLKRSEDQGKNKQVGAAE